MAVGTLTLQRPPGKVVDAGTYTPTLTNSVNVSASTAFQCQWMRVDNIVTVSGRVDVDPVVAGNGTVLDISLPIASNLGASEDCAGTASADQFVSEDAAILGNETGNTARMGWITTTAANHAMFFTFTYRVIP